ncbi:CDP-glycerol glycerophosphotransferase family protein [Amphibacillus sp. Q70]|uniref:CDP-glycerol glycerophosphotransferase family protein n=1 Tax=Amphibacillus sp. Q70 TaxID=3453416 RepID=UPI003F83F740
MKNKQVILFGASEMGKKAFIKLKNTYKILYFCDNDPKKINKKWLGVEIISPQELNKQKDALVIITSMYTLEIAQQLISLGIHTFAVYYKDPTSLEYRFNEYYFSNEVTEQVNDQSICLITTSNSGSNILALYKLMPERIKDKYNITLCQSDHFFHDYHFFKEVIKNKLLVFDVRSPNFKTEKNIFYQLWHGFPLKALGTKVKTSPQKENWNIFDQIASYSELYNGVMGECFSVPKHNFSITGLPRNDFLYSSNGRELLAKALQTDDIQSKKIVFYMPTYRKSTTLGENSGNKNSANIFGFDVFNLEYFTDFLKENDIVFVTKLHPLEEVQYSQAMVSDQIYFLDDQMLFREGIDLYQILNAVDLLITDYSSIYIDFLLLNRPMLFTPTDLEDYMNTRGLILNPYEEYTPGPKVIDQLNLQRELLNLLSNHDLYLEERTKLLKIFHTFTDGHSAERIWSRIEQLMLN